MGAKDFALGLCEGGSSSCVAMISIIRKAPIIIGTVALTAFNSLREVSTVKGISGECSQKLSISARSVLEIVVMSFALRFGRTGVDYEMMLRYCSEKDARMPNGEMRAVA
jgi:hypothetical protein